MKNLSLLFLAGMALCCWTSGCRRQMLPDDLPKLYSVKVSVVQEGNPLEAAQVSFIPADPTVRWTAGGRTDAKGTVVPVTHGQYRGIAAGEYKVVVTKIWSDPSKVEKMSGDSPINASYHLVDPKYASEKTTPLEIRIEKKDALSFDVGKAVKVHIPYVE